MFLHSSLFPNASVLLKNFIKFFIASSDKFTNIPFTFLFSTVLPKKLLLFTTACGEFFNEVGAIRVHAVRFFPISPSKATRLEYDFVARVAESVFYLQQANG